ncbi:hypothetical protein [Okeania sp. KiyG1]|uniref:hypothetical protein n=1 Tax=Okeania sp. KiyG1 TaxID=2720165 RepID=UPI0019223B0D|nr:hypothetical protein [Okeania sp. KiyG1]GGA09548.1 hypothetical protein CYANOKiyG1_22400 [Okeania sp. KiyG1]
MEVIFTKNDDTAEKIIDVSPDSKVGESREVVQMLLGLPESPPYKVVLERTSKKLRDNLTFKEAGIQDNDKLILFPLNTFETYQEGESDTYQDNQKTNDISSVTEEKESPSSFNFKVFPTAFMVGTMVLIAVVGSLLYLQTLQQQAIINEQLEQERIQRQEAERKLEQERSQRQGAERKLEQERTQKQISRTEPNLLRALPEQALRNYYQTLNNYEYQSAWNSLSSRSQRSTKAHPEGYKSYIDWWTQVARIDVLSTKLVSEDGFNSIVDSRLRYFMKSGREINQTLRFYFVWDTDSDRWLVNKVERL